MIGLLQRDGGATVAARGAAGLRVAQPVRVLVGVERGVDEGAAGRLVWRPRDSERRMTHSAVDAGGSLLLVPQLTLAADTAKGLRPGFSRASAPGDAERLFGYMAKRAEKRLPGAQSGRFGAHMRVSLVNDGPVTFWIRVPPDEGAK